MMKQLNNTRQNGNIFAALFGTLIAIGLLGAMLTSYIKGPLQSSLKITRQSAAEAQMNIAGQNAVMLSASASNSGDCDSDGLTEPLEWRSAGAVAAPVGGGLIPTSIAINKIDPWGTEYGYCVWDHGSVTLNASCQAAGSNRRLGGANSTIYPVVAIVSAGPDKTFSTTCRAFSAADVNANGVLGNPGDLELIGKASSSDDDVIFTYTYQQASAMSGDLWSLKPSDATTAAIAKSLEVTGSGSFSGVGTFQKIGAVSGDFLEMVSGLKLASPATVAICNASAKGYLRLNTAGDALEICDGVSTWTTIGTGGGGVSWPLSAPDGASNLPSYSFVSNSGAGFWFGGSNALKINSTGLVDMTAAGTINFAGASTDFRVSSAGGVKPGFDSGTCASGLQGTLRYDPGNGAYEFCNGSAWGGLAASPTVTKWLTITTNRNHSCGIKIDGKAWCWGADTNGQLGNGTSVTATQESPYLVDDTGPWIDIAAGVNYTVGLKADGTVWRWGGGTNIASPTQVTTLGNPWTSIAGGFADPQGIRYDGTLYELVSGSSFAGPWKSLGQAGYFFFCNLKADGTIWCKGSDSNGALGNGAGGNQASYGQIDDPGPWLSVALGYQHACGIKADGSVWCWGLGGSGQIGNGGTSDAQSATAVSGGGTWKMIGGSSNNSCGIKTDGTAWCWGADNYGNLGNGPPASASSLTPVQVSGTGTWKMISVASAGQHTCGIKTDGTAWCWGWDIVGQLGNGPVLTGLANAPTQVQ